MENSEKAAARKNRAGRYFLAVPGLTAAAECCSPDELFGKSEAFT
jgi:hypothetical protein